MAGGIVAIIPARGVDPDSPHGPESLLAGKPVLAYTIDAAKASRVLDRVIVTTDSPSVAVLARRCGAEAPFLRPAHLAVGGVPMVSVLQHAVRWLEEEDRSPVRVVVVLEVTHPLRPVGLIDSVVDVLQREQLDTVFAAREERHRFWRAADGGLVQVEPEDGDRTRDRVQPVYKELAGMASAVRAEVIRAGQRVGAKVGLVPVRGPESAVDLHDADGWALAEHWLAAAGQGELA